MPWFLYNIPGIGPRQIYGADRAAADAAIKAVFPSLVEPIPTNISIGDEPFTGFGFAGGGAQPDKEVRPPGLFTGLETSSKTAAYRRGLERQGIPQESLLSNYLDDLYDPYLATFAVESALGQAAGGQGEDAFQQYVKNTPIGTIRGRATQAFNALGTNAARGGNAALERFRDPYAAARAGGDRPDATAVNAITTLAQQAAADKYSPTAASYLFRSPSRAISRYEAGGYQGNIIDELRRFYGL